jgi:putative addiction module killer protein
MVDTMVQVLKSDVFAKWIDGLKDRRAAARVIVRIERLARGNSGDIKPVGSGISELRIDYGPGYRVYLARKDETVIILLCGGDKTSQQKDIAKAIKMAEHL